MRGDPVFIVRSATPDDRQQLYPLVRELATSFEPSGTAFAASFSSLIADPNARILVAAETGSGQLIGYLLGFRHEAFFSGGPVGWVEEVHTRSDRRRTGVAGALVQEFEDWAWASGARLVAVATRRAHAFYKALGYDDSAVYFRKLAPE
jgi:GNAT superfamily N-acetyltransferase